MLVTPAMCRCCSFSNVPGLKIFTKDFGSVDQIMNRPYGRFADRLVASGYRKGVDLFGAPYDFRLARAGLQQVCLCTIRLWKTCIQASAIYYVHHEQCCHQLYQIVVCRCRLIVNKCFSRQVALIFSQSHARRAYAHL